jgi:hypothetical protein
MAYDYPAQLKITQPVPVGSRPELKTPPRTGRHRKVDSRRHRRSARMTAWLVSTVPSWLLFIGLIAVIAGGAILMRRFLRRRYPALARDEHNDITKFTYGFIGFVYAFFIGFVVSAMWGQINTADGNARNEGAAAVQIATNSAVFDAPDRERVRQSLLAYEHSAVDEWERGATTRTAETDALLADVYAALGQVRATTEPQKTLLAASYSNLDKLSQARTVRMLTARGDTGPPWPLWAVILLNSGLVLGTAIVYGVDRPVLHYAMVAIVGIIVAANIFLVLELSHPYLGVIGTSVDPLREALSVLS